MKHFFLAIPLALLAACSSTDKAADSAASTAARVDRRAEWITALRDSVDSLQRTYNATLDYADASRAEFEALLERFEIVNDPMLVEQYRVVRGWKDYDTTGRQGVLSRVLEDGTIEIVATIAGDFNSISISNGHESVSTSPVPAGDALHTNIGNLTRVAFNNSADVAEFVYSHKAEPLKIAFSNGKSFDLSQAQKDMIADTYNFSLSEKRMSELDKQKTVIYNKLLLCQDKLAELEQTK